MRRVGLPIRAASGAAAAFALTLLALALLAAGARAADGENVAGSTGDGAPPAETIAGEPASDATEVPGGFPDTPADYETSAPDALEAADGDPRILARKAGLGADEDLTAVLETEAVRVWEVGYFLDDEKVNLVIVNADTGLVKESWTGSAVDWPMARGREGQFGHLLNAPWVWGPLAAIFLLGLVDFRRWRRWVHLDLLVLLSFGISQAYFNAAEIGVSVPLHYPPLVYLLARMLWIGFRGAGRRGTAGEGLRPSTPLWLLTALVVGLIGLRLAANIADSGVIDVGYAGVIGADRITDAEPIYGDDAFPDDNPTGDTYGPANYFAYVPFEQALPWSGSWDELPAAHAAAIFFDLATLAGLFMLGRVLVRRREGGVGEDDDEEAAGAAADLYESGDYRDLRKDRRPGEDEAAAASPRRDRAEGRLSTLSSVSPAPRRRGLARLRPRVPAPTPPNVLGLTLVFAWVAYPYTTFAMQGNSNDALLSALLVWSLLAFAGPVARGGLLAVASLAKFAPLALVPLYAAGERGIRLRGPDVRHALLRPIALFAAAFVAGAVLLLAHPAVDPGLADFYERTVESQVDRVSPFSIWGQADLEWLQTAAKLLTVALAVAVAFVPRERSLAQIAALGAAVIIAVEITLEHWFYLYIPWFLGAMLVAMAARPRPDPVS